MSLKFKPGLLSILLVEVDAELFEALFDVGLVIVEYFSDFFLLRYLHGFLQMDFKSNLTEAI